jgi:putative pyruvate formate lyase activating enzyme
MTGRYLSLYQSGELARRAAILEARLADCDICPRRCHVNRLIGETGFCRAAALPVVASYCAHRGEEPPISGANGSGTIFFGNCNLHCCFCQNYQISQQLGERSRYEITTDALAEKMLYLQDELGCHNINLVSPSHFVPQIIEALLAAVPQGLKVPLVYNSGGYDAVDTLRMLDGIIDIYLPDLRYADSEYAKKYSDAADYPPVARAAIAEMHRQAGVLKTDADGVARSGLIVRHLILPQGIAGSEESLTWLARELSPETAVSIMSQYHPCHRAYDYPELTRQISTAEYEEVRRLIDTLNLENGWIQEMGSAEDYLPDFEDKQNPFK